MVQDVQLAHHSMPPSITTFNKSMLRASWPKLVNDSSTVQQYVATACPVHLMCASALEPVLTATAEPDHDVQLSGAFCPAVAWECSSPAVQSFASACREAGGGWWKEAALLCALLSLGTLGPGSWAHLQHDANSVVWGGFWKVFYETWLEWSCLRL